MYSNIFQVNRRVKGKTALHVTCTDGYIRALKTLLEFGPDLESLVGYAYIIEISLSL